MNHNTLIQRLSIFFTVFEKETNICNSKMLHIDEHQPQNV